MTEINKTPLAAEKEQIVDNRPTAIKVDDVTMMFNIASEQLNNLKEYAIAIARRELMFKEFLALQNVSFEVKKGDVFGILGTNGSGKSTMMKIIAGVLEPTKGSCTVNGNIAPLIELGAGFDMDLTARENVYLNGALLGYSKKFIDQHFDQIVEFAEVEDFLDMPLKNYSSGMVARIAFAIATVIVPEILLVDEVLSVGDFMFQKKCENRIKELIDQHGVTVIIVSHSNEQIARLCNKAIWIEKGHTRILGDAQDVCRVYGSLGGRKGSKESERLIFDRLSAKKTDYPVLSAFGSDPIEASVNIANARRDAEGDPSWVIFAPNSTHLNSLYANSLAGVLNACVLQTRSDYTSSPIEHYLALSRPENVMFVDCGEAAGPVRDRLKLLDWNPQFEDLSGDGYFPGYSVNLIKKGLENDWWSDTFCMIDFVDVAEAVAIMPYLASHRCPVLATLASEQLGQKELDEILSLGFKRVLAVGPTLQKSLIESCKNASGIDVVELGTTGDQYARCTEISQWVFAENNGAPCKLALASADSTQWPYVYSAAGYLANSNGALLMEDSVNLDAISQCMAFVSDNAASISQLIFMGSPSSFNLSDYELLNGSYHDACKNSD